MLAIWDMIFYIRYVHAIYKHQRMEKKVQKEK